MTARRRREPLIDRLNRPGLDAMDGVSGEYGTTCIPASDGEGSIRQWARSVIRKAGSSWAIRCIPHAQADPAEFGGRLRRVPDLGKISVRANQCIGR